MASPESCSYPVETKMQERVCAYSPLNTHNSQVLWSLWPGTGGPRPAWGAELEVSSLHRSVLFLYWSEWESFYHVPTGSCSGLKSRFWETISVVMGTPQPRQSGMSEGLGARTEVASQEPLISVPLKTFLL